MGFDAPSLAGEDGMGVQGGDVYLGKDFPRFYDCFHFKLLLVPATPDLLVLHNVVRVYKDDLPLGVYKIDLEHFFLQR